MADWGFQCTGIRGALTVLRRSAKVPITAAAFENSRGMNNPATRLPDGAENVSMAGFNLHAGPFYRLSDEGGTRRFAFVAAEKHMNAAGSVHGGLLMTFADVAMSKTSRLATGAKSCSTVSASCDFVGPGRLGDLVEIRVRVTRRARTLVFLSANIEAQGRTLMVATGLWKIVPA